MFQELDDDQYPEEESEKDLEHNNKERGESKTEKWRHEKDNDGASSTEERDPWKIKEWDLEYPPEPCQNGSSGDRPVVEESETMWEQVYVLEKERTDLRRDEPDKQNRRLPSVQLEGMFEKVKKAAESGDLDSGTHKRTA